MYSGGHAPAKPAESRAGTRCRAVEAERVRRKRPGESGRPAPTPSRVAHLPRRSVHRHTPAWRLVLRARRHPPYSREPCATFFAFPTITFR
ncbi:unnamed protein product, partial [Brenthis ino]